ncbi:secondary thiamine-phosphate synthase enzyme YjbQ [Motilimonas pumila]|uniref:YjbQ family protein n=1 Tax=Motilimonas pumila TaxID=2303987 RepID=A0A418YF84_9GAMM|nr:secondary thiamine-phosphate synthase enzyme YjbQ [Motilimonas pumila]RJG47925.1 YjbQ family protein [Motilimonas pumila]
MWQQVNIQLSPKARGFHLVTEEIVKQLPQLQLYQVGLCHLFLQHTSASISINENADPTVRLDLESHFNHFVPEGMQYYQHDYEGLDDMPAHIKSATLGCQLSLPISQGQLALGCWQGITLGEHRDRAGSRTLVVTLQGQLTT